MFFFASMHRLLTVLVAIAMCHSICAQHVFSINDFRATGVELSLAAGAQLMEDRLRLTSDQPQQQGAAWYSARQIRLDRGFETEFTFLITSSEENPGDGFAFIMQDQSVGLVGGTGDAIGYKGIPYVMAIEFDTKNDGEGSRNHVNLSFWEPGSKTYRRYATVHEIPELTDGSSHFTRIVYNQGELQVFLDSYMFPVLSVRIDIAERVASDDSAIWMGFTASTSDQSADHDLLSWTLTEFADQPEIAAQEIDVMDAASIEVRNRKLRIRVWDHNTIDGDIISLKWGDKWVLSNYELQEDPCEFELTVQGFQQSLILYANNVGQVPPNTAMISVFDGERYFEQQLNADLESSEALVIRFGSN